MRQIRGKTALVSGAASGIGRAIALQLAREGARLYLLDVNATGLSATAGDARRLGAQTLTRTCDLRRPPEITAAVRRLLSEWGGLDILVNNAGVAYYGRTTEMSGDHWNELLAVNLHAPIQLTRELLPALLSKDEAHLLNVASICGLVGLPKVAAYTTSKFALVGFGEALRMEYGPRGLGVTALCPGLVDTNLFAAAAHGRERPSPKVPPRWMLTTPDVVARRAVRAIYRNQAVVVIQPTWRALYLAKRLAPGLLELASRVRLTRRKPDPAELPAEATRRPAA
jgi:short-subunit dehydrogenase